MTYARGADAVVALPPATYKIHVSSGLVSADITATAGLKGETLAEAVLNAGAIVLKAPLAADATVTIYEKVGGAAADNPSGKARHGHDQRNSKNTAQQIFLNEVHYKCPCFVSIFYCARILKHPMASCQIYYMKTRLDPINTPR